MEQLVADGAAVARVELEFHHRRPATWSHCLSLVLRRLDIGGVHGRVSLADDAAWGEDATEVGDFVSADGDVGGGEVLPDILGAFGAGNRYDVEWLSQQPC
ncbi:MAG TPA: hypothetical protein VE759_02865 [Mycobacterium sp.]|nr:hypothetical protein [Mycobacterium sp.]HZA08978.1 hypothetical protein [Mycobacterium sp.]